MEASEIFEVGTTIDHDDRKHKQEAKKMTLDEKALAAGSVIAAVFIFLWLWLSPGVFLGWFIWG